MVKTDIINYKIQKYTSKLKSTSDINKATYYQNVLRKYHKINRLKQYGGNYNYNTNYDIITKNESDTLNNYLP